MEKRGHFFVDLQPAFQQLRTNNPGKKHKNCREYLEGKHHSKKDVIADGVDLF
jgi:hypothetical protein